jgi:hypothetical protein
MWDLWWTMCHCGRFSPSTSVSPANSHFTDRSTIIFIYHLGLVQQAKQLPMYQMDSVSPLGKNDKFYLDTGPKRRLHTLIRAKIKFTLQVLMWSLSENLDQYLL